MGEARVTHGLQIDLATTMYVALPFDVSETDAYIFLEQHICTSLCLCVCMCGKVSILAF